jgi:DNA polymerase III epsilon subunit-like protein
MSKNAKYLVLDTEATGLHPAKNCLIQVGAILADKDLNILKEVVWEIKADPSSEIDPVAMEINGIDLDNREFEISQLEFCKEFIKLVKNNFEKPPIVIAQFYPFDYAYLDAVFSKNGFDSRDINEVLGNNFIDTKSLAYYFNYKAEQNNVETPFPITSLSKEGGLADKLEVFDFQAHNALGDCRATLEVLKKYKIAGF